MTSAALIKLARSFDEVVEQPHFEKISFRVNKKIFATLDVKKNQAVVKLSEVDQSVFSDYNPGIIFPVRGGWGKQGWTAIDLKAVKKEVMKDAITTAYCTVASKRLSTKYRPL